MQYPKQVRRVSSAAENVLLAQTLAPANPTFVVGQFLRLSGMVDVERLVRASDLTLAGLDAATARFAIGDDGATMHTGHDVPPTEIVDLQSEDDPDAAARAWAAIRQAVAINPSTDPCIRSALLILGPNRYLYHLLAHHVALDAFGIGLLIRKISAVYDGREATELSVADVVSDEEDYRCSGDFHQDREFWLDEIGGVPAAPTLAGSGAGPAAIATTIRTTKIVLPPVSVKAMLSLGAGHQGTWIEALTAAIAGFVGRACDRDEVIVGFPTMARMGSSATRVPTTSVNVVPLRLPTRRDGTPGDVIDALRQARTRISAHSRYRGEDIARAVRSESSSPIVGPSINIKPFGDRLRFAGLEATVESLARGPVTDLSITAQRLEGDGSVELAIDADADRYTAGELGAVVDRLTTFIDSFCTSGADARLGWLPVITQSEASALPVAGPALDLDGRTSVVAAIRRMATSTPDAVALRGGQTELTYRELIAAADHLADRLRARGVGGGDRVALLLPRTPDLVVALLAVLSAGAAYVPLDPRFPADRLDHMLGHSDPRIILTTEAGAEPLTDGQRARVLLADGAGPVSGADGVIAPAADRNPDSVAYVIYTSGSTGIPKGVAISDRAMANLVQDMSARFAFGPTTVMLAVTTISFDIAVLEVFSPLIAGGTVVVAGNDEIQDPRLLADRILSTGVNVMQATPALWSGLLTLGSTLDLRGVDVLVGGEQLPESVAGELASAARGVWNMYGPTETTVWSTVADVESAADITIGRPIANTRAHVLDRALQPVPVGVVGELYLAGDGVAAGYVHQSALTASRFIADPAGAGSRMYRTGDLARWLPDGRLDCLGRSDDQVKVRGFRVELGDVETAVATVAGTDRAVAKVIGTDTGGRLVAYVTGDPDAVVDQHVMRTELGRILPEYMIPSAVLTVRVFPQTPNGKIDRKALPDPDFSAMTIAGRGPGNPVEAVLCAAFAQVLGLTTVGVDDDFFGLGGDSIAAVRVVGAAGRDGVSVTAGQVFDSRTVAQLARFAAAHDTESAGSTTSAPKPVTGRPDTVLVAGLSQDEFDEFEGEGGFL